VAQGVVGLILRARDEATATIRRVNAELGGITKIAGKLSGAFGLGGLGVSAMLAAGAAIATLAQGYAKAVQEQDRLGLTMGKSRAEFEATRKEAAEVTLQLDRMGRGWKELTEEVGRRSLSPAATELGVLNAMGRSISAGRWKEFFALLMEGPFIYKALEDAHRKEIEASDKAAEAQERERAAREAALAAAKERARRIDDIARAMRVARVEATFLLDLLDRIDRQERAQKIQQRVFEGLGGEGKVTDSSAGDIRPRAIPRVPLRPSVDQPVDFDFAAHDRAMKAWLATMPKISAEFVMARENWRKLASDVISGTQLMRDAWDAFGAGVDTGSSLIAARFGDATQTIKSAWSTMVHSVEQEFYQMLARIAAAQIKAAVISTIGNLIFPGAGSAAAAGAHAAGGGGTVNLPESLRRSRGGRGTSPQPATGATYNIYLQSYTPRDVQAQLLSPGGAVRVATEHVQKLRRAGQD